MRTLEKLLEHDGKIFIRLENTTVAERFLRNAEKEGLLMQNGQKPTESEHWSFYQLFHDKTITPFGFGFAGSMLRHQIIHGTAIDCVSIDYLRYISGDGNYIDGQ
jgi:hypothetical protein